MIGEVGVIVCSCAVISSRDIEFAVAEIMAQPNAPLPTPGTVFRHLNKRMQCCTCAPVTVDIIYAAMDKLQHDTRICPYALAEARAKLAQIEERRARRSEFQARRKAVSRRTARVA
jgi:bacterioferritin-associated ferredoxin